MSTQKTQLFRIEMAEHICPSGLKAKALLEKNRIAFEGHKLSSSAEADAFKSRHDVETTPQI